MRRQRNFFKMKEQGKNPEKTTNETEISNLPDKMFKALVTRMLTELGKRIDELGKRIDEQWKFVQGTRKYKKELVRTEMKNTPEGINRRLGDTEECKYDLKIE